MQLNPRVITYKDELLADGSVRRAFSDENYEWRRRLPDGRVEWQDSQGYSGIDELLGDGIIKRELSNGRVVYGREQGYGRTLWYGGRVLTVNQTSFGGRVGQILMGMGAGFVLGQLIPPPDILSPEQEAALRAKLAEQQQAASGGYGGSTDWGDSSSGTYIFDSDGGEGGDAGQGAELEAVEADGGDFGDGDFGGGDFDGDFG
ncbi:MAG: hypothetical protein RMK84_02050 [Oscillochloridaceae bacterium]|nr:hypothetical protein [Chloroflexaceae bacterium]MDW8388884.1 hypothetical protein [Oscillochloridaceae bacterium]